MGAAPTDGSTQTLDRDALTGLATHSAFQAALDREISRCQRHGHPLGLVLIDVDGIGQINDSFGFPVGDQVLRAIASLVRTGLGAGFRLREHDLAARFGPDEIALLLPETNRTGTAVLAERLRAHIAAGELGAEVPVVTVSVGLACFADDGRTRTALVAAARAALAYAQRSGSNSVIAYSTELDQALPTNGGQPRYLARLAALERVIAAADATVSYQPIVSLVDERPIGCEALSRPRDPALGSPRALLSAAAEAGRVVPLGRVLRRLARASSPPLRSDDLLFVNLHPLELHDQHLLEHEPTTSEHGGRLVLELTETRTIVDFWRTREAIARLRQRGFLISLDDLGTGYAGLNALVLLEPDFVKVGADLLRQVLDQPRVLRLLRHLIDYARGERVRVMADGLETEAERRCALDLGFELGQGLFFAGRGVARP